MSKPRNVVTTQEGLSLHLAPERPPELVAVTVVDRRKSWQRWLWWRLHNTPLRRLVRRYDADAVLEFAKAVAPEQGARVTVVYETEVKG